MRSLEFEVRDEVERFENRSRSEGLFSLFPRREDVVVEAVVEAGDIGEGGMSVVFSERFGSDRVGMDFRFKTMAVGAVLSAEVGNWMGPVIGMGLLIVSLGLVGCKG